MNYFTKDLCSLILARLPLKSITTSKVVCKQWKSVIESPYFRNLFMSQYQNLHSSLWSLLVWDDTKSFVTAHYGCEPSMGSYLLSFLTDKFKPQRDKYQYQVWDYTDNGLILISDRKKKSFYVANLVSQECIELPSHDPFENYVRPFGIVTQTENGVVLCYKVVLYDFGGSGYNLLSLLVYSSETGLWSLNGVHLHFPLSYRYFSYSISLKGSLYWLNRNSDNEELVIFQDFFATGTQSNRCRVTFFPDLEKRPKFKRACTRSQGLLMYMNIVSTTKDDGSVEDKLSVWRLKNEEWQLATSI